MKKIRLLQITHDLAIGGLQQVVVNLCRTIDRDKFNITVLCLRARGVFAEEIEKMGIKVFLIPQKKNVTDYFSFTKVASVLHKEKTEVIHTHNTQPFIDGTIGALLSKVKTIIHTDHAREFPDKKRYMVAEKIASLFAYKVVGVSDHTTKNLQIFEKISPKKLLTIPNGIDGGRFDIVVNKNEIRNELGITRNGPIIGLGVRLSEQKGIVYLLLALVEIIIYFPDITLLIAGEGPLRHDLERMSHELGIAENVKFIGPRKDIPRILKVLDLYVLPSLWEGLPMVLLEALAAQCPVVATDVGGVSTIIKNLETGSLVQPCDPKCLAAEIIRLLKDEKTRLYYAENGLKLFKEHYSARAMTEKYEKLYLKQAH